jgi:hypothetical protein
MTGPDECGDAWVRDGLAAAAWAGTLGGAPSTLVALARGEGALEASRAAGTLLLPGEERDSRLLPAAVAAHGALSLGWGIVLAAALPRERTVAAGAVAGLAIAALDLGLVGRAFPRIHALPLAPQVADHLAFGLVAGLVVAHRRRTRGLRSIDRRGAGAASSWPGRAC